MGGRRQYQGNGRGGEGCETNKLECNDKGDPFSQYTQQQDGSGPVPQRSPPPDSHIAAETAAVALQIRCQHQSRLYRWLSLQQGGIFDGRLPSTLGTKVIVDNLVDAEDSLSEVK